MVGIKVGLGVDECNEGWTRVERWLMMNMIKLIRKIIW